MIYTIGHLLIPLLIPVVGKLYEKKIDKIPTHLLSYPVTYTYFYMLNDCKCSNKALGVNIYIYTHLKKCLLPRKVPTLK